MSTKLAILAACVLWATQASAQTRLSTQDFVTKVAVSHMMEIHAKTTRIYAGSSSRRASRAYNQHLFHLPESEWPEADRQSLRAAYEPGDIFDETAGPGAAGLLGFGLEHDLRSAALKLPEPPGTRMTCGHSARGRRGLDIN